MNRFTQIIIVFTALFFCTSAQARPPAFPHFMKDQEIRELSTEAAALALIHHLSLSVEQREQIKGILKPLRTEFDQIGKAEQDVRERIIKPRLRQVIEALKAGREPDPDDLKRDELETFRGQMATLFTQTDQAYEAVQALLDQEQKEKLRDFRLEAYLGPIHAMHPKRLFHMEPIKMLNEIHEASPEEIDRLIQKMTRPRGPRTDMGRAGKRQERREEKTRLLAELIRKINAMPQEEFEKKVELLPAELQALMPHHGSKGKVCSRSRCGRKAGKRGEFGTKRIMMSKSFYEAL